MATTDFTTKTCHKCGQTFPATTEFFHKRGNGLRGECKPCINLYHREWSANHPEQRSEHKKRWLDKNPNYKHEYHFHNIDRIHARKREYYLANRASILEKSRNYRLQNPDKIAAAQKLYYLSHREICVSRSATYYLKNSTVYKIRSRNRKQRVKLGADFTQRDWDNALEYWGNACAICGKSADFWTVIAADHWNPLAKGGLTTRDNIVPLCHARKGNPSGSSCCNNAKHDSLPEAWLFRRLSKRNALKKLAEINTYFEWSRKQRDNDT